MPDPRIFVVDDDPAICDSLLMLLQARGLNAEAFGSAGAFLEAVPSAGRGCILLDMRLPDISGIEVLQRLNARSVRLPVIMITAYADVPLAVQAMKAGAIDFIQKPYSEEDLLRSVGEALEDAGRITAKEVSAADVASRISRLTPRERDVLQGLVLGKQNKQIAYDLGISPRTVEIHRARVLEKMQARTLSHLVRMTIDWKPE